MFSADDVYDSEDAKQRAAGYLQNRSMEYQTGAVKCEGNRHIFPGMRIEIKYVGDYFSGEYIAERVVHELSVSRGFTTEVYVKRNMTAGGASQENTVPSSVDAEMAQRTVAGDTMDTGEEAGSPSETTEINDATDSSQEVASAGAVSSPAEEEKDKVYNFGKINEGCRGWQQQDELWAEVYLCDDKTEENMMKKIGCKVVAASKIVCTIAKNNDFKPPWFINEGSRVVDNNGNLSQSSIMIAINNALEEVMPDPSSRPEVKSDYFEHKLNETTLKTLSNDPENINYILGRATLGGGLGQHWVVIEGCTILDDNTIEYQVVSSSKNDAKRKFKSNSDFATDSTKAYIDKIEVYSVKRT